MTEPTKPAQDQAHFSPALLGFYASCALVSSGAGAFFFALFVLTDEAFGALPTVVQTIGALFMLVGIPGAFYCLTKARTGPAE